MVQAVYLEDCACGTLVFGNIFYRARRAVQIFVDCELAVYVDARGLT
ncbi:MAG: hypothetical protein ACUVTL_05425 [Thermoproteota archaeon]